jgi:hypothetical protein
VLAFSKFVRALVWSVCTVVFTWFVITFGLYGLWLRIKDNWGSIGMIRSTEVWVARKKEEEKRRHLGKRAMRNKEKLERQGSESKKEEKKGEQKEQNKQQHNGMNHHRRRWGWKKRVDMLPLHEPRQSEKQVIETSESNYAQDSGQRNNGVFSATTSPPGTSTAIETIQLRRDNGQAS